MPKTSTATPAPQRVPAMMTPEEMRIWQEYEAASKAPMIDEEARAMLQARRDAAIQKARADANNASIDPELQKRIAAFDERMGVSQEPPPPSPPAEPVDPPYKVIDKRSSPADLPPGKRYIPPTMTQPEPSGTPKDVMTAFRERQAAKAAEAKPPEAPETTPPERPAMAERPTETLPVTVAEGVDVPVEQPVPRTQILESPQKPTVTMESAPAKTQTLPAASRTVADIESATDDAMRQVEQGVIQETHSGLSPKELAKSAGKLLGGTEPTPEMRGISLGEKYAPGFVGSNLRSIHDMPALKPLYAVARPDMKKSLLVDTAGERMIARVAKTPATKEESQAVLDSMLLGDSLGRDINLLELRQIAEAHGIAPTRLPALIEARNEARRFFDVMHNVEGQAKGQAYAKRGGYLEHWFKGYIVGEETESGIHVVKNFDNLKEAAGFAKKTPGTVVAPRSALRSDESMLMSPGFDKSKFEAIANRLEKSWSLSPDEARIAASGMGAQQHRFLGNMMQRKGKSGFYADDLIEIMQYRLKKTQRYVQTENFKNTASRMYRTDYGLDPFSDSWETIQKTFGSGGKNSGKSETVAKLQYDYIHSFNGDVNRVEGWANRFANRAYNKLGLIPPSSRPSLATASKAKMITSTLKMGFSPVSAGVQVVQALTTMAKTPVKFWPQILADFTAVKPDRELKLLYRQLNLNKPQGITEGGWYTPGGIAGNKKNVSQKLADTALVMVRDMDQQTRMLSAAAARRIFRAEKPNGAFSEMVKFADDFVRDNNFDTSVLDTPMAFRNVVSDVLLQYKPWAVKFLEATFKMAKHDPKAFVKLNGMLLGAAGVSGIPMATTAFGLLRMIGPEWDVETAAKQEIYEWISEAKDDKEKKMRSMAGEVIMRGLPGLAGVDVGRRIAPEILPTTSSTGTGLEILSTLAGPTLSTPIRVGQELGVLPGAAKGREDEATRASRVLGAISPAARNMYEVSRYLHGKATGEPYSVYNIRGEKEFTPDVGDMVRMGLGARPSRSSRIMDVRTIEHMNQEKIRILKDRAIAAIRDKDQTKAQENIAKAMQIIKDWDADGKWDISKSVIEMAKARSIPFAQRKLMDAKTATGLKKVVSGAMLTP